MDSQVKAPKVRRRDNWPTCLAAFIESRKTLPFTWGKNDCCLFACDAVLAMTGVDLAHRFRGTYYSAFAAQRMIEGHGARNLGELATWIAELHGIEEITVPFAQRGDVLLIRQDERASLAIVALDGMNLIAPGQAAMVYGPVSAAERAWRI